MKQFITLILFLILASYTSFAQKQGNVWCFGDGAGLNFNSGAPVAFSGVAMDELEGCSSMADANGNLLLYSDGLTAWNKNNAAMPNGTGLLGNISSTQSALIVKQPGSSTIYYLFTTDAALGPNGFNYSIVDMSLDGGLGDITTKNVNLLSVVDERVSAVMNANGTDIWIITTTGSGSYVNSYLLTNTGLNTTPVITSTGIVHSGGADFEGYLKPSPSGNTLAVAYHSFDEFDLYDFNRSTGVISNPVGVVSGVYFSAYGIEFSPNGKLLYLSTVVGGSIYQLDITSRNAATINSSAFLITSGMVDQGAVQLGPDGKIYIAEYGTSYLGVISNPNLTGAACGYNANGVSVSPGGSEFGLPYILNNPVDTTHPAAAFSATGTICASSCIRYSNTSANAVSYQWYFPGGTPSSDTSANPTVCYSQSGQFDAELIAINGSVQDTLLVKNYITVNAAANAGIITSSPDTICTGTIGDLEVTGSSGNLQWQSGATANSFTDIPGATKTSYSQVLKQSTYFRTVATNGLCSDTSAVFGLATLAGPSAGFTDSIIGKEVIFTSATQGNVERYYWSFGDTGTSKLADPVHTFGTVDTFDVCLTVFNASNCNYTICHNIVTVSNAGIDDVNENSFRLFPNPATCNFYIVLPLQVKDASVEIFNDIGQKVKSINSFSLSKLNINTSDLSKGVYFVRVISGMMNSTVKVVIE